MRFVANHLAEKNINGQFGNEQLQYQINMEL